jgi:transporter family protein
MAHLSSTWPFWAVLSAVFAAATAILAKLGVAHVPPDLATLIRTIVIAALLGLLVVATGQARAVGAISPKAWIFLVLSGFATGASWLCDFRALKLGPAAQVAPVDKLSVVFVAILGVTLLGERLSALGWTGVGFIAVGAALVAVAG